MIKEQLLIQLKEGLLKEIPNAVKKIKLEDKDKVCYISLLGTDEENVLGLIQLGIDSYRNEIIEENGIDDKWIIWNSGEMPVEYQIGVEDAYPEFPKMQEELMNLFEDEEWDAQWEACQELRFQIAYELNVFNWSDIIPITDDFVVYSDWESIDVENGDLNRSIPSDKMQKLSKKGLV